MAISTGWMCNAVTLFSGRRTALRTHAFDDKAGVFDLRLAAASRLLKGPGLERLKLGRTDLDAFRPAGLGATRRVPRKAVKCILKRQIGYGFSHMGEPLNASGTGANASTLPH